MAKITLSARIKLYDVTGSVMHGFITQEQYEFTDKQLMTTTNPYIEKELLNKVMFHYKVTIDVYDYWVPICYCVEYDKPFPLHTTDKKQREYDKYSNDSAKDVYKQYHDMLGRVISNRYRREVSWLYAKLLKGSRIDAPLPGDYDKKE